MSTRPQPGTPEYLAAARKQLHKLWKSEKLEATNEHDAVEMIAWDLGYQGWPLYQWLRILGAEEGVDVAREHADGVQAGQEARENMGRSQGRGHAQSAARSGVHTTRSFDALYEQLVDALNGLMREHDIDPQVAAAEAVKYVQRRRGAVGQARTRPSPRPRKQPRARKPGRSGG